MTDLTKIFSTGTSSQRIDIVFVAEGYQTSERGKFLADVQIFTDYIFSVSNNISQFNSPFSAYKKFFNVNALFVASNQSGTDQPNKGIFVDTYFNSTQYGADGRLNYGDQAKLAAVLSHSLPVNEREISVVLINSSVYGGSGGLSPWVTTGDITSAEVLLHELGHSFASLEDEYIDLALENTYPLSSLDSTHITKSLSDIPWREWMGHTDKLGTVGLYEGGYYRSSGVWRATLDSKMLSLGQPFSAPQKEAFVLAFYKSVNDYLDVHSEIPGLLAASVLDAGLLRFDWSLNGQVRGEETAFFDAYGVGAYSNGNTVTLTTTDNSGYVRKGLVQTQQTETVKLKDVVVTDVVQSSYVLNQSGSLVRMDAQDNQIRLSAGAHNNYIDGGLGMDTLILNAASSDFELHKLSSGTSVFMQQGQTVMAAINVEKVQFADKSLWIGDVSSITIKGTDNNDYFTVMSANDGIDGRQGIDTVVFFGKRTEFSIASLKDEGWIVFSAREINTLQNIERLKFNDGAIALDIQGNGGQAYRLYQAAFDRTPDEGGLGYWIEFLDNGGRLVDVAAGFVGSLEFQGLYGNNPGSSKLVTRFYQNVLHREPEPEGWMYWVNQIDTGAQTVQMVLSNFSESPENQANLLGVLSNGFDYTPCI